MSIAIRAVGLRTLATLLRRGRARECAPGDHLVTVVRERRVRDGLARRYWIRCRVCGFERGPYTHWQAAWLDAWRTQIAARRCEDAGRRAQENEPGSV
jgi:hypothetical protein